MDEIKTGNSVDSPQNGKALMVFVRPKDMLFDYQAGVFHKTAGDPALVGILAANSKVAYQVEPGKHLFMSVVFGGGTRFISADILANKTYYVLVRGWTNGWGVYRFYLDPVHREDPMPEKFNRLITKTRLVEKTSESEMWASENMASIMDKLAAYNQIWRSIPPADRPHLREKDGW